MEIRGMDALNLPSVQARQSLRAQVTTALRASLLTGELRPGTVYSAPALAAEFGVSATPVREAMLDLVKEGLVEVVPNKGFRVAAMKTKDLLDFCEIRMLLEVPAFVQVAAAAEADELESLREPAQETVRAAAEGDLLGFLEADHEFHLGVLALHGNQHLLETVRQIRQRARLYGITALLEAGLLIDSAMEHERLLDLMLARDLAGVRELTSRHVGRLDLLLTDTDGEADGDADPAGGDGTGRQPETV
ncbi:GntR family transcriptional regulator [Streptacidiphilus monticola]|uniref:GntR family transcriptional regulator n=1 Tax=Streptacidiphilus monticola TaxID=2161674 RepID=A0ABW1G268_9ACTN